MSPVNSMFVCIIKKNNNKKKKLSANLFWKLPISITRPIIGRPLVTFNQFNTSLLNKSIHFFKTKSYWPNLSEEISADFIWTLQLLMAGRKQKRKNIYICWCTNSLRWVLTTPLYLITLRCDEKVWHGQDRHLSLCLAFWEASSRH